MTRVYIQVSTRDQNENHQLAALANLGIAELNLFWTFRATMASTVRPTSRIALADLISPPLAFLERLLYLWLSLHGNRLDCLEYPKCTWTISTKLKIVFGYTAKIFLYIFFLSKIMSLVELINRKV